MIGADFDDGADGLAAFQRFELVAGPADPGFDIEREGEIRGEYDDAITADPGTGGFGDFDNRHGATDSAAIDEAFLHGEPGVLWGVIVCSEFVGGAFYDWYAKAYPTVRATYFRGLVK